MNRSYFNASILTTINILAKIIGILFSEKNIGESEVKNPINMCTCFLIVSEDAKLLTKAKLLTNMTEVIRIKNIKKKIHSLVNGVKSGKFINNYR